MGDRQDMVMKQKKKKYSRIGKRISEARGKGDLAQRKLQDLAAIVNLINRQEHETIRDELDAIVTRARIAESEVNAVIDRLDGILARGA